MDDLEFRTRAFSNPRDNDPEFINASRSSNDREKFMEEVISLDDSISDTLTAVTIPDGLSEQLKQQAGSLDDTVNDTLEDSGQAADTIKKPLWQPRNFALAASLIVAVSLGLMLTTGNELSARDLAFHDELISHLYSEESRYNDSAISWGDITQVIHSSGGQLHENNALQGIPATFANNCRFSDSSRAAHIVLKGEKGPVSVIFSSNPPVSSIIPIRDERFEGKIIPLENGNLTIVGENKESLDNYEAIIAESVEWPI